MKKNAIGKARRHTATGEFVRAAGGPNKVKREIVRISPTAKIAQRSHYKTARKPRKATTGEVISDRDNPPLTAAQLARARPVSQVKRLRWRLSMSQREFSESFGIPIGTLRDWEQNRSKPDAPARGFLAMIADDPKRAREVISTGK